MKPQISPHVSIYKFPITAISSIMNRITGFTLSSGFILLGISSFYPKKQEILLKHYNNSNIFLKYSIHTLLYFPVNFHVLGGFRHILWDIQPNLLKNKKVSNSSYALFGFSSILSFVMAYYTTD
uniref:Uncharacterized protein n=1 Tax=viral metagenome TaxID=1070528 RepID=A0A6C0L019_9ZZZZ|tara:strand:- start:3557 stop:3928 length:372 start_codon:yes stop_codon:yes gene_type:complete